jgi:hypothetical protein
MTAITNDLMYEVLKAIRADVTDLKRDAKDTCRQAVIAARGLPEKPSSRKKKHSIVRIKAINDAKKGTHL